MLVSIRQPGCSLPTAKSAIASLTPPAFPHHPLHYPRHRLSMDDYKVLVRTFSSPILGAGMRNSGRRHGRFHMAGFAG